MAEGSFSDLPAHTSNFGQLRITTHPVADDAQQVRAAGYLEGYLTAGKCQQGGAPLAYNCTWSPLPASLHSHVGCMIAQLSFRHMHSWHEQ